MKTGNRSFLDLSPQGVLLINQKGVIVDANYNANNMFDCIFKNKNLHIDNLIGPHKNFKRDLFVKIINNDTACRLEKTLSRENRENIEVEIWVKKRKDNCYMGFVHNITEQKKDQEKLKNIVRMQSHDVRAPLANIMGLISLVDLDTQSKNVNKSLLTYLRYSAERLDGVIRNIVHKAINVKYIKKTRLLLFVRCYILFCKSLKYFKNIITRTFAGFIKKLKNPGESL